MQETQVQSLGRADPLEKGMGTHSSTLAWKISWTGSWQTVVHVVTRVGYDLANKPPHIPTAGWRRGDSLS